MVTSEQDYATAYHEAGHAVAALRLNIPLENVCLQARTIRLYLDKEVWLEATAAGGIQLRPEYVTQALLRRHLASGRICLRKLVRVALAGSIAEQQYQGFLTQNHLEHTLQDAALIQRVIGCLCPVPEEGRKLLCQLKSQTEELIRQEWPAVSRLAEELLQRSRLNGRQARRLYRRVRADQQRLPTTPL
jgi:hypothetical protein